MNGAGNVVVGEISSPRCGYRGRRLSSLSRLYRAWALMTAAGLTSACQLLHGGSDTTLRCEYGEWSSPRTVNGAPAETAPVLRWSSLASSGRTIFVAGNEIPLLNADTVREGPLLVWELGGRDIGKPKGPFRFIRPLALTDGDGALHLVWGEVENRTRPITGDDFLRLYFVSTSVWTARYSPEDGWSTPRQLIAGDRILWSSALLAVADDTTPKQWAFSVIDRPRGSRDPRLWLARFKDGELVATEAPPIGRPIYSSLASQRETVYLSFVSPATPELIGDTLNDANSVFFEWSSDDGASWHPPVLVSLSGESAAHYVQTLVTPDRSVHLVWWQERMGAVPVVRHVASSDGGRSWSAPDDLTGAAVTEGVSATSDRCGALHVVFNHLEPATGRVHIDYARWENGWSPKQHLFTSLAVADIELFHAPDDRLLLSFLAQAGGSSAEEPIPSRIAELSVRRPSN